MMLSTIWKCLLILHNFVGKKAYSMITNQRNETIRRQVMRIKKVKSELIDNQIQLEKFLCK